MTSSHRRRVACVGPLARRMLMLGVVGIACSYSAAQTVNWNNPLGGAWSVAGNWNPATVPGNANDAVISLAGIYSVTGASGQVRSLAVQNATASLSVEGGNNPGFTIGAGGLSNNGLIAINGDGIGADGLTFAASGPLPGTGVIELRALAANAYDAAYLNTLQGVTVNIGSGQTIRGNGNIYGSFHSEGTIIGGTILGPQVQGVVDQSGGGRFFVGVAGQSASVGNGRVIGGTLETANGGWIYGRGNGSIEGVTITSGSRFGADAGNNPGFGIAGTGAVNHGTITVNSDGVGADGLTFRSAGVLEGSGEVVLAATAANAYDTAYLNTSPGFTAKIGANQTVRGNGNVYGSFTNEGTFAGGTILGPQIQGIVEQAAAGRFFVGVAGQNASIGNGTVIGGTFETANAGWIYGRGNGSIQGVTITAGSQFGVEGGNNPGFGIAGAGVVNHGTIRVNTNGTGADGLTFRSAGPLSGTGEVVLGATAANAYDAAYLDTLQGVTAVIGAGQTIRGDGNVYGNYNNQGTIGGGSILGPQLQGTLVQSSGGRFFVGTAGQSASIGNGTVIGGALETASGGWIFGRGNGNLQGVTITAGSQLGVDGGNNPGFGITGTGITNNGTLAVNTDQIGTDVFSFRVDTTIGGSGSIILNATTANLGMAYLNTASNVFGTVGSGQAIRGGGILNGNFLIGGAVSPGIPPGSAIAGARVNTLAASNGSIVLEGTAALQIELASATVWDRMTGNSPKTILNGASLTVSFINAYVPAPSTVFDVLVAETSAITGRFSGFTAPAVPFGPMHAVYLPDRVRLVTCYANCDGSIVAPVLNVADFTCFLNDFASGEPYANCDGSTIPPVLNVQDFTCFLNKFAAGCT